MATIDLPNHILQALSTVLQQLQQNLPELKQETDFSASAYKWQDKQLKAIQQPKKMYLDDLKGIERQKRKKKIKYCNFSRAYLLMMFCLPVHVVRVNLLLSAPCSPNMNRKVYV